MIFFLLVLWLLVATLSLQIEEQMAPDINAGGESVLPTTHLSVDQLQHCRLHSNPLQDDIK